MAGTAMSGRQPAQIEAQRDFREELTAHLAESRDFAEQVKHIATRIRGAALIGSRMAVIDAAGQLGYEADRRLVQIGSVVL